MKKVVVTLLLIILSFSLSFSQSYGKRFSLDKENNNRNNERLSLEEEKKQQEKGRQQQRLPQQQVLLDRAVNAEKYRVGPGDGFSIIIETGEVLSYTAQVNPSGKLLIPTVGIIDVNKMILDSAVQKAVREIKATYKNSQVNVALMQVRKFKLQISGAVNKPGFYEVTPVTRLDEIIEVCEGFHQFAKDYAIRIKRNDGTIDKINYLKYLRTGDLSANPTFIEGENIRVPYGDVKKRGIMVRGAVEKTGYDLIEAEETIEDYIMRGTNLRDDIELSKIFINRDGKNISVTPDKFHSFQLQPGDKLSFLSERGVAVNGFVQAPGGYNYIPGYTCADYIGLAGGNTVQGDIDRVKVRHINGEVDKGLETKVRPGDVIIVPRTRKNIIFGESSILQIITSVASLYLTYIAATR